MQKIRDRNIVLLPLLCLGFFLSRLVHLTILPIFGDEAIYLNWSQTIREDPRQLFIPLSDGKQPLFMWLTSLATFVTHDPLWAPRLVSTTASISGMIGVFLIGKTLFNRRVGLFAAVIYFLTPIIFFYDHLGVPDDLLSVFGIWSIFAAILLYRKPSFIRMLFLAATIGLGILTKSPALLYIILLPLVCILPKEGNDTIPEWIGKLAVWFGVGSLGAIGIAAIMWLSPLHGMIRARTGDFIISPTELYKNPMHPISLFFSRITEVFGWLWGYLTATTLLVSIAGLIIGIAKRQRAVLYLFAWFLLPMGFEMALAKGFTPRYFLFTLPPLLIIAAYAIDEALTSLLLRRPYSIIAGITLLILPVWFIGWLIINPAKAPIPEKERAGYLEEWTAGYGIADVAAYLKSQPVSVPILAGTEGHFGTLPDGLIDYNRKSPNIHIEGMGQAAALYHVPAELYAWLLQHPNGKAYLVVNQSRMFIQDRRRLQLVARYPKPAAPNGQQDALLFYEVKR